MASSPVIRALTKLLIYLVVVVAVHAKRLPESFYGVPGTSAAYDYVIVGGGTAGLALATRLAEGNATVAVVEAGGLYETDNGNLSVVPGYVSFNYYPSSVLNILPQQATPPLPLSETSFHDTLPHGLKF